MSKLHFLYGTMSASKSTKLLTDRYNFINNGVDVLVMKPSIDRTTKPIVSSRIGIQCPAVIRDNLDWKEILSMKGSSAQVYMIDEIQFFKPKDIDSLVTLADEYNKLIFCFGLLVDINENLFPTSKRLIEVGAKLHELKTSCQMQGCMNLANHHVRFYKADNSIVKNGESVAVDDGKEIYYKSVCRQCYNKLMEKTLDKQR